MEVLGRKETLAPGGARVVVDVTTWTLLGLCVDHFYKAWARHGAPAVLACDVHQNQKVNICNVVEKWSQKCPLAWRGQMVCCACSRGEPCSEALGAFCGICQGEGLEGL